MLFLQKMRGCNKIIQCRALRNALRGALTSVLLLASACSTTKLVPEGEHRLKENKVVVVNPEKQTDANLNLSSFYRQKANAGSLIRQWIYNWGDNSGSKFDKWTKRAGEVPVIYDSIAVYSTEQSMLSHLEFLGYYGSSITDSVSFKGKLAEQFYFVHLGKQYPVHKIDYIIKDSVLKRITDKDSSSYTIHKGSILSEKLLENESTRLSQVYRNNGFWGFTKNYFFYYADTTAIRDSAELFVRLEDYTRNEVPSAARPHKQYCLNRISIVPQRGLKVRQSFLDEINRLHPGDMYNESAVTNTYERFSSVPLFQSVSVELSEADSSKLDCLIALTPSKLQSLQLNLEASVNSSSLFGISPSIQWTHKNIFGGGERLSLGFMGNFQTMLKNTSVRANEFGVSANLTFPKFLFLSDDMFPNNLPRTEFQLTYNYQNRPEYTRNILSASYGYRLDVGKTHFLQIYPLQMSAVRLYNVDADWIKNLTDPFLQYAYKNHFDLGSGVVYYFTTNPKQANKTYFYLRSQTDVAGNVICAFNKLLKTDDSGSRLIWGVPYAQYVRENLMLVYTYKFGRSNKFGLAFRLDAGAGYAYGNSTKLPFERLFWVGGANSLRGWQARSVGPGSSAKDSTFKIANQTGDMKIEANVEFRFPIFNVVYGCLFYDAGNVWNLPKKASDIQVGEDVSKGTFNISTLGKSVAMDYGLGLRVDLTALLVRVDFGVQLFDPVRQSFVNPRYMFKDNACALHLGIGLPF